MGMEDGRATPDFLENRPEDPRVEAPAPIDRPNPNPERLEPPSQLTIPPGNHHLINAEPTQLARQKPYLALPTTPLSSGGDVDDGRRHVPGSTSAGRAPESRTDR